MSAPTKNERAKYCPHPGCDSVQFAVLGDAGLSPAADMAADGVYVPPTNVKVVECGNGHTHFLNILHPGFMALLHQTA